MNKPKDRLAEALNDLRYRGSVKSQQDFGEKLGYNKSYISELFNGRKPVTESIADQIQTLFAIDAKWLLTGDGEMLINENRSDKKDGKMEEKKHKSAADQPDLAIMLHNYIEASKIRAEAERINNMAILEQSSTIKILTELVASTTKGVSEEIGSVANNHYALLQMCASNFAKLLHVDKDMLLAEYRNVVVAEAQKEQNMGTDLADKPHN